MANRKPKPKAAKAADMRDVLREKCGLAQTFADDGAYHSAGRVLAELAETVKAHAASADEALQKFILRKRA